MNGKTVFYCQWLLGAVKLFIWYSWAFRSLYIFSSPLYLSEIKGINGTHLFSCKKSFWMRSISIYLPLNTASHYLTHPSLFHWSVTSAAWYFWPCFVLCSVKCTFFKRGPQTLRNNGHAYLVEFIWKILCI